MIEDGERVSVSNQHLAWAGAHGTVILTDRHGQVWVRLDGYGREQTLPFDEKDLSTGKGPSPLVYGCEESEHPFAPVGCTGPVGV